MIYVDTPREYGREPAGYRGRLRARIRWGHLIADTDAEAHVIAQRLGLRREWWQGDHYDLVPTKRLAAIRFGAVALDRRAFVAKSKELRARRTAG